MRFGRQGVPNRPKWLLLAGACGQTFLMLTLDQILDGLSVEVMPFALCEARGAGQLDLGRRDYATMHYVLAGSGVFNVSGWPGIMVDAGTVLITPPSAGETLQANKLTECEALICAPLDPQWHTHQAGSGPNGVIVACGEIKASYCDIDGLFNYLQEPLVTHMHEHAGLKLALDELLNELAAPKAGTKSLVRALMQQCMIHILRSYGSIDHSPLSWMVAAQDNRLWHAVELMLTQPEAPHSLESLAKIAQMSRSSFADHFKTSFGYGPIELLKQVRMRRAARMLMTTDRSKGGNTMRRL